MQGISIKGIVVGVGIILLVDLIIGLGLAIGLSKDWESFEALAESTSFLVGGFVFGTLSTVLGGYVAARIAKTKHLANAGVVGAVGIVLGALSAQGMPLWFNLLVFLSVVPAALFGGFLASRKTHSA